MRFDQSLRETGGSDQRNQFKTDFTGPLHWFPVGANWIARLSQKVDRVLQEQSISVLRADLLLQEFSGADQ